MLYMDIPSDFKNIERRLEDIDDIYCTMRYEVSKLIYVVKKLFGRFGKFMT